jgi:hypothetical protein
MKSRIESLVLILPILLSCDTGPTQPANHAPTVSIVSPAHNTFGLGKNVTLRWSGNDQDNDPLTYTVYFYKGTGDYLVNTYTDVKQQELSLTGLDYNMFYQWCVKVSDGKDMDRTSVVAFKTMQPPIDATWLLGVWKVKEIVAAIDYDGFEFRNDNTFKYYRVESKVVTKSCSGTYSVPTPGTLSLSYSLNSTNYQATYHLVFDNDFSETFIDLTYYDGTDILDGLPGTTWTLYK